MARNHLIQLRRDTEANWTSTDPVLAAGEVGLVTDTNELVVGDGATAFSSLARFIDKATASGTYVGVAGGSAIEDANDGSLEDHALDIQHYGDGSGATTQTYGLNISNHDGARSALVIHQYSNVSPCVWIDNTDNQPAVRLNNTTNPTLNPDGPGSPAGAFLQFQLAGTTQFEWTYDGILKGLTSDSLTAYNGAGGRGLSVQNNGNLEALEVLKAHTGSAAAIKVKNYGTGYSLDLQDGSSTRLFSVAANGEPEVHGAGDGIILASPDGTRYRVTVANGGTLTVTAA